MDPLEWLARISDHIPDPGQHRTIFYGEYSSRARAGCQPLEPDATSTTADHPPSRRRIGTSLGPPWGADQKGAALLAWLVLAVHSTR
jgi:hypothetical protein